MSTFAENPRAVVLRYYLVAHPILIHAWRIQLLSLIVRRAYAELNQFDPAIGVIYTSNTDGDEWWAC